MVDIVISNNFVWKRTIFKEKSDKNLQKQQFLAYLRHLWPEKFFFKIGLGYVLSIPNLHYCLKIQEKQMMKSRENAKKTRFLQRKICELYNFFNSRNLIIFTPVRYVPSQIRAILFQPDYAYSFYMQTWHFGFTMSFITNKTI